MSKELTGLLINILQVLIIGIIPIATKYGVAFFDIKKKQLEQKVGKERYDFLQKIAYDCYSIVEEKFRNNKGTIDDKVNYFEEVITRKCPNITKDEIDHFRQAICGAINYDKKNFVPSNSGTPIDYVSCGTPVEEVPLPVSPADPEAKVEPIVETPAVETKTDLSQEVLQQLVDQVSKVVIDTISKETPKVQMKITETTGN